MFDPPVRRIGVVSCTGGLELSDQLHWGFEPIVQSLKVETGCRRQVRWRENEPSASHWQFATIVCLFIRYDGAQRALDYELYWLELTVLAFLLKESLVKAHQQRFNASVRGDNIKSCACWYSGSEQLIDHRPVTLQNKHLIASSLRLPSGPSGAYGNKGTKAPCIVQQKIQCCSLNLAFRSWLMM